MILSRGIDYTNARAMTLPWFSSRYGVSVIKSGFTRVPCPWHDDDEPSLVVYGDLHVHCFACGKHGDLVDLYARVCGIHPVEAAKRLLGVESQVTAARRNAPLANGDAPRSDFPGSVKGVVATLPQKPLKTAPMRSVTESVDDFAVSRGLNSRALSRLWGVRFTVARDRPALTYPTPKSIARLKYLDAIKPKYCWVRHGGQQHWYGLDNGSGDDVLVVNGEPSVWAATEAGLRSCCTLGGESWKVPEEMLRQLRGMRVSVVFDLDPAGVSGSYRLAADLRAAGVEARAYLLPRRLGYAADVGDLYATVGEQAPEVLGALQEIA